MPSMGPSPTSATTALFHSTGATPPPTKAQTAAPSTSLWQRAQRCRLSLFPRFSAPGDEAKFKLLKARGMPELHYRVAVLGTILQLAMQAVVGSRLFADAGTERFVVALVEQGRFWLCVLGLWTIAAAYRHAYRWAAAHAEVLFVTYGALFGVLFSLSGGREREGDARRDQAVRERGGPRGLS